MPSESVRLSKSRYLAGLQCHKQLWWRVHDPEAPELSPTPGQQNLFVREDVTALVAGAQLVVQDELVAQQRMLASALTDVPIGEHCTRPYECPFIERCWPKHPVHHVSKLYRIERKWALELEADGY